MAKRQQAFSKDEDLIKIPLDQEVLVSLAEDDKEETEDNKKETGKESTEVKTGDDDTVEKLEEQIEALRESNKQTQKQLQDEQRERRRVEQAAQEIVQEAVQIRSGAEKAAHSNMKSALAAAQSEQEAAKKDYANFLEAGDFVAAAESQQKMSRAAARVVQVERDISEFETQQSEAEERAKHQPRRQTESQPVDVLTSIDQNPNLMPEEKKFLKSHPELMADRQKNAELGIAYQRAMNDGLSRGTPEYFEFIENFMGIKKSGKSESVRTTDDDEEAGRAANGAPVRRDNAGQRREQRPSQVKLTPEQREIARNMGISEVGYARNMLKLQNEKQSNPEKYNQRQN